MFHPRDFLACDGVGWHKRPDLFAQGPPSCLSHVSLGRADIHDQRLGRDQVFDRFEGGFGGRHGDGDQHNVGARHRQQGGRGFHINHAHLAGELRGGGGLAVAHNPFDQSGAPERQRK